ncbi:MAG: response regulator [bacterium]
MKIGKKISLVFIVTTLLITIVSGYAFYTLQKKELKKTLYNHLHTAVESKTKHIETSLQMYTQTVNLLANEIIFKDLFYTAEEDEEFENKLKRVTARIKNIERTFTEICDVSLCNKNGQVLASTYNEYIGTNKKNEEIFIKGKKDTCILDLHIPARREKPIIESAAPISRGKYVAGVIIIGISPHHLFNILSERTGLGETGEVYLVNNTGYMISPSRFLKETETILKKKSNFKEGPLKSGIFDDYRGTKVLRVHRAIPSMQWFLLAQIDRSEALKPLLKLKLLLAVLLFIAPFLAWLISVLIAKVISSPIHKLEEGIEEISNGDFDYKTNITTNDEIEDLSCAIDNMTEHLKSSTTSIENLHKEIAARKQLEKTLEGSGKRLEAISDIVRHISFVITDLAKTEPNILEFSQGAEHIFGYKRADVIGRPVTLLHPPEDAAQLPEKFKLLREKKEGTTSESMLVRSSGEKFNARLTSYPIFDERGNLTAALDVACDITKEKKEEEALREGKDRALNYLEAVGTVLVILDQNNKISFINKKGCKLLGCKKDEVKGKNWIDIFITENQKDKVRTTFEKLINGELTHLDYMEYPILTVRGEVKNMAWYNTALIKNERINRISIVCTGGEVSAGHKEVSADHKEVSAGHKDEKVREHAHMQKQEVIKKPEVSDTSQIKSHILEKMSREIKHPMNDIMNSGALLKDSSNLDNNQKKYVETITKNSEAILALISDVLDISKIAENKIKIENIGFDLEYLIDSVLNLLRSKIADKPVELYSTFKEDMPTSFKGDPTRIRQILIHLVTNAIRFTKEGKVGIHVSYDTSDHPSTNNTGEAKRILRITVKDTGVGIPQDKQKIIHDIFNHTDMIKTTQYEVRWLGLTVTKHLIEMMGGKIWVESKEGKGSEFIFTVCVKETMPVAKSQITPLQKNELKGKRIAVIEDFENPRRILDTYCSELGMKVLFYASSVNETLEMLEKESEPPDMILCDITMAAMDGSEIARNIKAHEKYKKIKLVAISSYTIPGAAKITQALGFDAYLPKPIIKEDLIKVIQTTLGDNRESGQIITRHMYEELALKGLKILLAEDNAVNQKLVEKLLQKFGCEIDMAWNGKEAIEKSEIKQYDIILMDIDMPVMNGLEAAKIIHNNINKELPIIALTSNAETEIKERGKTLAVVMNDYIQKPVSIQSLKEKLFKWTKRDA